MSIALLASPAVRAPLQGLWRRLMATTAPGRYRPRVHNAAHHHSPAVPTGLTGLDRSGSVPPHTPKPLRIVRILEAGQAPTQVGRMLISGRMADVCAELERLAAHEAALQ